MEYKIMGGQFDLKKHHRTIKSIETAKNNQEREKFFKKIAKDILKNEGFYKLREGPTDLQGVPFDFIACNDHELALIEMKGARDGFNYSSDVQYSRFQQVVNELNERDIRHNIFMLQINLKYGV